MNANTSASEIGVKFPLLIFEII